MIHPGDVSVVIQGAFHEGTTTLAIDTLRAVLPGCEIIVSTWKGRPIPVDPSVCLILNDDPGPSVMIFDEKRGNIKLDNCNRQIVSTMGGIAVATRPYIAKLRSDMLLRGRHFLEYFERYQSLPRERPSFKKRIICNASGTVDPRIGSVAHPGDFFFFGLADDIRKLYEVPLYVPRQMQKAEWIGSPVSAVWPSLGPNFRGHFCPEMHIWCHHLFQNYGVEVNSIFDYNRQLVDVTLNSFLDNLIPLNDDQIGLDALRHRSYGKQNYWRNFDNSNFTALVSERYGKKSIESLDEHCSMVQLNIISSYKHYVASLYNGNGEDHAIRSCRGAYLGAKILKMLPNKKLRYFASQIKNLNKRHSAYLLMEAEH